MLYLPYKSDKICNLDTILEYFTSTCFNSRDSLNKCVFFLSWTSELLAPGRMLKKKVAASAHILPFPTCFIDF